MGFLCPQNRDVVAPAHERPPLIVISHGGPTSATSTALNLTLQYWTSRGFGVLDVNYGGSTGYGRAYRERLKGQWGIVDVDDCVNGARYLVDRGDVDSERLIIRGASAGGYTPCRRSPSARFFMLEQATMALATLRRLSEIVTNSNHGITTA